MRPQNQSERQSAIFRFWAIYMVALLFPIVAFFYIFKNSSGGANGEDYKKLKREIAEFQAFAKLTKEIDSLSNTLVEVDQKLINRSISESEKPTLEAKADQIIGNLKKDREAMVKGLSVTKSDAVKVFLNSMPKILNNFMAFHGGFIKSVDLNKSEDGKDKELTELKSENTRLNGEIGKLNAQVSGLQAQLTKKY